MELKNVKWFTGLKRKPRQGHTRYWGAVYDLEQYRRSY